MKKLLLHLLLLGSFQAFTQSYSSFSHDAVTKVLHQYLDNDAPGVAIGVVKDGEVVYEHYMGYANLEHLNQINQETRFNIASNAKQFTALSILKLIHDGKLQLDDDFRHYVPNLYLTIEDKITISNLLTHTSGIRDYCDLLALTGKTWWKQFIDNDDVMDLLLQQKDLNFKPGTEYLYSNSNYTILTEVVKSITGEEFSLFAKNIFESLGMPNTSFLTNYMSVIPNKARPYGNWNGWKEIPVITEVHGDGALFTTLKDQLTWEQILQNNNGKYFSKELINESQSPLESSMENGYGYGLEFDTYGGWGRIYHNGATGGYRASFSRFPSESLSIVVMTNNRDLAIDYLVWDVLDVVLGLEDNNPVYPSYPDGIEKFSNRQELLGIYKGVDESKTIIKIVEREGELYREIYQRDPVKLISEKDGLFYYETTQDLKMNFSNIGKVGQKMTLYKSTQKPSSYIKISDLDMNGLDKTKLNGRFVNEETGTEIILKHKGDNSYSLIKNGRERNAELLSPGFIRMMDSYKINIMSNNIGEVKGLNVSNNRIKNVIFKKTAIN